MFSLTNTAERLLGTVLSDRYELISVLGKGQSGIVFKARHRHLDRLVAVKIIVGHGMGADDTLRRFQQEARAIGRLNHPHVVTVFDFGIWKEELPFLVMDFVEGLDLHQVIGQGGRMALPRALKIASQVCSALQHAHTRGVIHRDLKPSNVMLIEAEDLADFVKLVDFGIAKPIDASHEQITLDGFVVGTPLYMSPEQCRNEALDHRSDIYSMGCVIYKMLTGASPVHGQSLLEIMQAQIEKAPTSFEEALPGESVPKEIQAVVLKALNKNPQDRQQSMAQLREELNTAFASLANTLGNEVLGEAGSDTGIMDTGAVHLLRARAVNGDPLAQYELVLRLEYGQGSAQNLDESGKWLTLAAEGGLREAQWRLGDHFLRGEAGFAYAPEEGTIWLRKSAQQNYDAAQFSLGWCLEHGLGVSENVKEAIHWYQKAAQQGNEQAKVQLSGCFERIGHSEELNADVDDMLVEQSESNPEAMYSLAMRLRQFPKTAADGQKAVQLLQTAADLGHVRAMVHLADELFMGNLVSADFKEASRLYDLAAQHDDLEAMLKVAACFKSGIGIGADPSKANRLLQIAVEKYNDPVARTFLAESLLVGDGINRNIPKAISLFKELTIEGCAIAQWKFGICHKNGLGLNKDGASAEKLFNLACAERFPQGMDALWNGQVISFPKAINIFQSLASAGSKNASYWLGIVYEDGLAVKRDFSQAQSYYQQAASRGHSMAQSALENLSSTLQSL